MFVEWKYGLRKGKTIVRSEFEYLAYWQQTSNNIFNFGRAVWVSQRDWVLNS